MNWARVRKGSSRRLVPAGIEPMLRVKRRCHIHERRRSLPAGPRGEPQPRTRRQNKGVRPQQQEGFVAFSGERATREQTAAKGAKRLN